jgi:hypothetical protein
MELSDRRMTLGFGPIARIASLHVKTYESRHVGPPVVAREEFEGLPTTWMSSDSRIVMLRYDPAPEILIARHVDLTSEHQ